jgi:predicted DCC family thiol-disulfide oxidoreductase YuxK
MTPAHAVFPLTLYFDGGCSVCSAEMHNLRLRDTANSLRFVDIAVPGHEALPPGIGHGDAMALIHARSADGTVLVGVDVFRHAYAAAGLHGVARALQLPWVGGLAERVYPFIARHRMRIPRVLAWLVFETRARRAAERIAAAGCQPGAACRLPAGQG